MKTILIYLFTFFVISFVSFSQILEVKTMTEALNYTGNRASVKKLIITDSIKGTDYSEGSEWREFRTLDTTFPNIEAVEILTDQDIPYVYDIFNKINYCLFSVIIYELKDDILIINSTNWLKYFSAPNTKRIGGSAFRCCKNLENVNFPNAKDIGSSAFCECVGLIEANFPNVGTIRSGAFMECKKLENINFPNVIIIGAKAFIGCENLESVSFGTNFEKQKMLFLSWAVFGDSVNFAEEPHDVQVFRTDKIKLTLGKNVLPVPNTNFNTWHSTHHYPSTPYVWKSIKTYTSIEEKTNEKNIYNLGNNKYKLENIEKAELFDLVGRKIMNVENQEVLDLNHLISGFYFIKYFDSNKILRIEKIIIN